MTIINLLETMMTTFHGIFGAEPNDVAFQLQIPKPSIKIKYEEFSCVKHRNISNDHQLDRH